MPLTIPDPIETARVRIRPVAESDLSSLMSVNGDEQVTRYLPYGTWKTMDDAQAWFTRMAGIQATGAAIQFVVVDNVTGDSIGTCLLFRYEEKNAVAELGFVLAQRFWGQGYMREAVGALIEAAFRTMRLRRLEATVDPRNTASTGLLRRLGFVKEGLLRERWVDKGQTVDAEIYGLLHKEPQFTCSLRNTG